MTHISIGVTDKCINNDSYGEICVQCNMCGRFGRSTMYQARYEHYIEELKELIDALQDDFFQSELQQTNIAKNIQYVGKELERCVKKMTFANDEEKLKK